MADHVTQAIYEEAQKLVVRHQSYAHALSESRKRQERRSGTLLATSKVIRVPEYWACDPGFNPYHVRKQHKSIARAIKKSLANGSYVPRPAVIHEIPKKGGGRRELSIFQVADQAVSRMVFGRLMAKNASRLNPHCYAYRQDKTIHDAILNIAYDLRGANRIYLAEYDFRNFFPSIYHSEIKKLLSDKHFYLTQREMKIAMGFLEAPRLSTGAYSISSSQHNTRGLPLGTSISLFIANLVAYRVAEELEKLGVRFAFYSDDSVVWSDSYSKVTQAAQVIANVAEDLGVDVNHAKSEGIRLLTPPGARRELVGTDSISFIGHQVDTKRITMSASLVSKAKQRLSQLIFANLLQGPLQGKVDQNRIKGLDRDYLVLISQIRRYLYGNLREEQVRHYVARAAPNIHYRGFMSFFPVVDDEELLTKLDGWLVTRIYVSLRRRAILLKALGVNLMPDPHYRQREELAKLMIGKIDLRIPSFLRMNKLLRSAATVYGPNAVANPRSSYYYL